MEDHRSNAFVEAMYGQLQQGEAGSIRLQDDCELHRHRLPANVQAQSSADQPVCPGISQMKLSRFTRNGIETAELDDIADSLSNRPTPLMPSTPR
jgi:hypothetical protein